MNFDSQAMWNKDADSGEFTGVRGGTGTTKSFFAGADNKEGDNAKFYALADGNIFHSAIGSTTGRLQRIAPTGDLAGNGVSKIGIGDSWFIDEESGEFSTGATFTETVLSVPFVKKFSENTLTLYGRYISEKTEFAGTVTTSIILEVYNGDTLVNSEKVDYNTVGSGDPITQSVDISSASDFLPLVANVILELDIDSANGSTDGGRIELYANAIVKTETG